MSEVIGARFGGKVSPHSLLANALSRAEEFSDVVVVCRTKDGYTSVGHSAGSVLTKLGMMDIAKDSLLEDLKSHR